MSSWKHDKQSNLVHTRKSSHCLVFKLGSASTMIDFLETLQDSLKMGLAGSINYLQSIEEVWTLEKRKKLSSYMFCYAVSQSWKKLMFSNFDSTYSPESKNEASLTQVRNILKIPKLR